jgi:predicted double-glycine peptidase
MIRSPLLAIAFVLNMGAAAKQPLDVPFFTQQRNGCGAASIAMTMRYWANQPGHEQVSAPPAKQVYQRLYHPERKGILLADMKRYLEEAGFRAFTLRGQWSDLEQHLAKGRPIVVGLKQKSSGQLHFAVLIGTEGDRVWLNDPTRRKASRVKLAEFSRQWELAERWMLLSTPVLTQKTTQ